MSQWTHVAATFRVDGLFNKPNRLDLEEIIGKKIPNYWNKYNEIRDKLEVTGEYKCDLKEVLNNKEFQEFLNEYEAACNEQKEHPELYIPAGGEGCLDYDIWENPESRHMSCYTVSVFGDLRDYNDVDAIKAWFKRVCERLMIRQAVCNIDVEFIGVHNISYVNNHYNESFFKDVYEEYYEKLI